MNYKFGWEITPEIKALEEDRIETLKRLERSRRIADILLGIALFLWAISMSVPLIVRLIK